MLPKLNTDEEDAAEGSGGTHTGGATLTNLAAAAPPAAKHETLTVLMGADEGRTFVLTSETTWIGRADNNEVVLSDPGVSRRHACLVRNGTTVTLKDNGAKNGTFVNNRRVVEHELQMGDEISLGPNVCLLFSDAHSDNLPQRPPRGKMLAGSLQRKMVDSIASMVANVAHEINTPLGVANTANAMIAALAEEVRRDLRGEKVAELLADLQASTGLVSKNLERASQLVHTFKQLSAHEDSDHRVACDLRSIIEEFVDGQREDLARRHVTVRTTYVPDAREFPWTGFERSLSQVLIQLLDNTLRHAYEAGKEGFIDIRLFTGRAARAGNGYRLDFEDYGAGVPPEILERMFEPFVTSRRDKGGMGLGLAIVRNIVTNVLGGTITCTSHRGEGTHFKIVLPRMVPLSKREV